MLSLPLFLHGLNRTSATPEHNSDLQPAAPDRTRTPVCRVGKPHLLRLVRDLHILQPMVSIPEDIAHRISFWGLCGLDAEDQRIVLEAVRPVIGTKAALCQEQIPGLGVEVGCDAGDVNSTAIMPNLKRVEVSSCDHYAWRALDLGGGRIAGYQDFLADCRQVMLALLAPWLYREGGQPSQVEWTQRTTNGPFVFPRAQAVDPATNPDGQPRAFDGDFEVELVADSHFQASCFPPLLSGAWNEVRLRRPMRERANKAEVLSKLLEYVVEKIMSNCTGELTEDTVVEFKGLFEVELAEGGENDAGIVETIEKEKAALLREIEQAVEPRWRGRIYLRG